MSRFFDDPVYMREALASQAKKKLEITLSVLDVRLYLS
jgi:hypothetical protein